MKKLFSIIATVDTHIFFEVLFYLTVLTVLFVGIANLTGVVSWGVLSDGIAVAMAIMAWPLYRRFLDDSWVMRTIWLVALVLSFYLTWRGTVVGIAAASVLFLLGKKQWLNKISFAFPVIVYLLLTLTSSTQALSAIINLPLLFAYCFITNKYEEI